MFYIYISTDGEAREVEVTDSYTTLRAGVGGFIERVPSNTPYDVWVNEDGLLLGLEPNLTAMRLTGYPHLAGPAVVTKGVDDDGDSVGFTREEADAFIAAL